MVKGRRGCALSLSGVEMLGDDDEEEENGNGFGFENGRVDEDGMTAICDWAWIG